MRLRRAHPGRRHHLAIDEDLANEKLGASRRLKERRCGPRIAGEDDARLALAQDEAEGRCDRPMVDSESLGFEIADLDRAPCHEFVKLDLEP